MDIEELNKSQIILLTLLVSFITSIATGIVTVTLMDQAPEGVTRTITQVVERTVESVKPGDTQVATVIKEVPVIVTEEELVLKAINIASPAVATLSTSPLKKYEGVSQVGTAFLIEGKNRFITSGRLVLPKVVYQIQLENGTSAKVMMTAKSLDGQVAILDVIAEDSLAFTTATKEIKHLVFSDSAISIGQSVIGIGASADVNHNVAMGIVSNLSGQASSTTTMIVTNASAVNNIGGPLIDIRGKIIGLNAGAGEAISKKSILALIDELNK
ncbi:MAG: hypothetical protein A2571_02140 [Candidatus Vogelbacteria bacterium RIFOXYD1_FULL_44_32]|uniref:Serine protease n=1 Tax=Candidatus Vogelbacteria bacterium RIFOXYD1_FULL_44_32 TaxID=1802438 RepID=A0A1G2QD98_9BACT|nr:MAG: hypothetical protein A2571_02140 [Candidatus Vogelbacteria bacterium RIFOXYD1_FULL_44_32]